jgi:hypothetical protein
MKPTNPSRLSEHSTKEYVGQVGKNIFLTFKENQKCNTVMEMFKKTSLIFAELYK